MAQATTTLNGKITNSQTTVVLTAYTAPSQGAIPQDVLLRIDSEFMKVVDASASPTLLVVRGYNNGPLSSNAVAHASLAAAAYGVATDMTQATTTAPAPIGGGSVTSHSVSGAITIPTLPPGSQQTIYVTKAGVDAMTLAAPGYDQDGLQLTVTSMTANAHTITATSLINDGATGAPHTTATFAAFAGASITLEASKGLWNVIANNNVTIS